MFAGVRSAYIVGHCIDSTGGSGMTARSITMPKRLALASAIAVATAMSGAAFAQTDKERELEQRVAQLESMVRQLMAQQEAMRGEHVEVREQQQAQAARLDALPVVPEGARPIQATTLTPGANPGTSFSYGGFIKLDAMITDTSDGEIPDGSVGRLLYLPGGIPVGGESESPDMDVHAQFSRFWLAADTTLDSGDKLRGYLEFDLFGGALGNEVATNTYGVTVRHAYATWNKWLAGQTWSNFQDVAALPDAVDFIGPTDGTTFVRQAQIRYSSGPWSISAENPESIITPFEGNAGRIVSDDNSLPDLTARYTRKGDWGHFGIAGLFRQIKLENTTTDIDDSIAGYGLSASGKWVLGAKDDIRYMVTGGRGISRYVGLAISNDAVLDEAGDLESIDLLGGFVAWRHAFSPTFRTNLFYARTDFDNDAELTGLGITKRVHSIHANAIWTPLPKLDLGMELIYGERELESGADGDLRRLHFHARYSF
jgi:hypothetical protein